MTKNDLPTLRQLAANKSQITYSTHGHAQMLARGYTTADVEAILTSSTNQLVEIQPPSNRPGMKPHRNARYIISDPNFKPDTAIVLVLDLSNLASPQIVIITVEPAEDLVWAKDPSKDPWLTRIGTMV